MDAPEVVVEAHLANGLPAFTLVSRGNRVKEARDRVRAAIQNARFEFPARRITVNLAPADLPKESGRFDLPIALAILAASGQIPADKFKHAEFAGELALTGELRPVRGALAMALATCCQPAAGAPAASAEKPRSPAGRYLKVEACWRCRVAGRPGHAPEPFRYVGAPDCPICRRQAATKRA
jgi:magnesium chelatase family protein